jgi:hypothetical protein
VSGNELVVVMEQSGPRYDDAMKALCAQVPLPLCQWLGVPVEGTVEPVRLSEMAPRAATRQVDALLAVGNRTIVHVELQSSGEAFFGWRMLDYRSLLSRRPELKGMALHQHAVVLGWDRVDEGVHDDEVDYRFTVHYLRDQPVEDFLERPELAPFAVLADLPGDARRSALRRALDLIGPVTDDHVRSVLAHAAVELAALRLDSDTIKATWEDSAMPIPSLLNETYEEGRADGREELVVAMLRQRFGPADGLPVVARRLATLDPDEVLARIGRAADLAELER